MLTRRTLLTGLGAAPLVASCGWTWRSRAGRALDRGVEALWALQSDDGAFRSERYGLLSNGWSLTPFALLSLLRSGRALRAGPSSRALGWIDQGVRDGVLGLASGAPDYPCYATALALECFSRIAPTGGEGTTRALEQGLRGFQLREDQGWGGHPACGAFRMGSTDRPEPPHPGHVDLSMTRRAVEALAATGATSEDAALIQALGFADRCHAGEGAYVYTATETALNKGHRDGSNPGYGTPTADALLLQTAAGRSAEALAPALAALRGMHRPDENPRVGQGPMRPYATAMRGYYRAAAARAFRRHGGPEGWEQALVDAVVAEQRDDGTWANERAEQKEDEPIVATGFAVVALGAAVGA